MVLFENSLSWFSWISQIGIFRQGLPTELTLEVNIIKAYSSKKINLRIAVAKLGYFVLHFSFSPPTTNLCISHVLLATFRFYNDYVLEISHIAGNHFASE